MKFLAVLQIVCIVFLSSFSMMVKPVAQTVKADCCEKFARKAACHSKKETPKKECDTQACNRMLTCNTCGFLVNEPVAVSPVFSISIAKTESTYKIGNAAGYIPSSWKPPQV